MPYIKIVTSRVKHWQKFFHSVLKDMDSVNNNNFMLILNNAHINGHT